MSDENDKKSASGKSLFGVKELLSYVLASGVASVSTWFAFNRRMGTNFHESEDTKAVKIRADYQREKNAILNDPLQRGEGMARKLGNLGKIYEENQAKYWQELGVKGLRNKWQSFLPHQKTEVIFGFVAISAVTLGAIHGLFQNRQIAELFHRQEAPNTEKELQRG